MHPETSHQQQPPVPRIIPRREHNLSRKNIDPDALKVLYRLHRHGFKAYLVGGSVRDLLLGRRPKDFDVGTDARPNQVYKLFRNSRIIGRRFRLVQVFFRGGKIIEVSTFRRAADPDSDEVLGSNNTFGTAAEDAMRRDLTINALFYDIADFSIVDYVGGMEDLQNQLVRAVGDADVRFHRDPVRVLRAVRHAARIGFTLTRDTRAAVNEHRREFSLCPTSRIRDELMRDLQGGSAASWLDLAHRTKVLYSLLPTLEDYYGRGPGAAKRRGQVIELMAKVDQAVAQGQPYPDAVVVAALFWPALVHKAKGLELPPGRAGRVTWGGFVRENLPALARPVAFAKRVMERACQTSALMAPMLQESPGDRLPKKITDKGYFPDACLLGDLLGLNLRAMAGHGQAKTKPGGAKRRRRRRRPNRRRRRRPPAKSNQANSTAS